MPCGCWSPPTSKAVQITVSWHYPFFLVPRPQDLAGGLHKSQKQTIFRGKSLLQKALLVASLSLFLARYDPRPRLQGLAEPTHTPCSGLLDCVGIRTLIRKSRFVCPSATLNRRPTTRPPAIKAPLCAGATARTYIPNVLLATAFSQQVVRRELEQTKIDPHTQQPPLHAADAAARATRPKQVA